MFVALSRFEIRNGMAGEVRQAFRARPHLVDEARGFLGMQVMSPLDNPAEIWLVTRGIPKGLKLVPGRTEIRFFDLSAE